MSTVPDPRLLSTEGLVGNFITVHTIRPVTGVNLNADSDGKPKSMRVGGSKRMRVSSQSRKRGMRTWMHQFIADADQAVRTRQLPGRTADELAARGHDAHEALCAVAGVLAATGGGLPIRAVNLGQSAEIIFTPANAATVLANIIDSAWDDLADVRTKVAESEDAALVDLEDSRAKAEAAKKVNIVTKPLFTGMLREITKAAERALAPRANIEIALAGRMLTALPHTGAVYGAMSVGHSMSVDAVAMIEDNFAVVEDWQDGGVFGAAHYADGKTARSLASGTLYEWASLDRRQLRTNLAAGYTDEAELDAACDFAERLFISAATWAIPAAAAHTTASMTPPTFVLVTASNAQPVTAPCFTNALDAYDAPTKAASMLCVYLNNLSRFIPSTGFALWFGVDKVPTLPEGVSLR